MEALTLFLLKSIIVSGILCAWYMLALKNKRLHNYNRFFLLFTLYASIQVPLLNIKWPSVQEKSPAIFEAPKMLLHTLDVSGNAGQASQHASSIDINWIMVVAFITALISAGLLFTMLARILWILHLNKRYPRTVSNGIAMVHTNLSKAPFSFMSSIYWRDDLSPDTDSGRLILRHELVHVKQKHTYDKLASQLLTCIFWMNPFYWIIQRELGMVHEFIADEKAITDNKEGIPEDDYTDAFARMLLQAHGGTNYLSPQHQFFTSPIKRRLIMLQTNKHVRASVLRRAAMLPLLACSIFMFGMRPNTVSDNATVKADEKIVLVVDPGHGGDDKGSHAGLLTEKEITLRVAERIKKLAPDYNVEVHLTRTSDKSISLHERAAFSNNLHPDFFICLHVNDLPGEGTFDIAINDKNAKAEESRQLAFAIYKHTAQPEWAQSSSPSEIGALVLKETTSAGVLIELGNIRSKEQMQHIQDDAKLNALSNRILAGVVEAYRHNR